jgi:hypothetical protein
VETMVDFFNKIGRFLPVATGEKRYKAAIPVKRTSPDGMNY